MADPWAVEAVAIDMSNVYREVIELCLPMARVVADRFHVVRRVGQSLTELRLRLQRREGQERQGELYELRHVLLNDRSNWTRKESRRVRRLFKRLPELERAWVLKEGFRSWYGSTNRQQAEDELVKWEIAVRESNITEFTALIQPPHGMLVQWREEILNYFDFHLTNGFVEGKNNRTKALQRQAYGYANPENLRLRVLLPKAA